MESKRIPKIPSIQFFIPSLYNYISIFCLESYKLFQIALKK
ncbi:hypothetical protein DB43_HD00450 [Parachlamydia acanthamoebae]|uniref:Uncharacterized protein n=1 Tax=Parachlamydia acanthamoebae TaxID=83552 RepID=A0A0C1EK79_9BACT|nr:hypothetical protein DB43_HD00450 [Parachlamydia acanthamoebae]